MSVARLGYIRFGARQPEQWRDLLCGLLGMQPVHGAAEGAVFIKMDDHPFRYLAEPYAEDRLLAAGWEFDSKADWQAAIESLRAAGVEVTPGDNPALREVTEYACAHDPSGNVLELYYGRTNVGAPFQVTPDIKGFKTGEMGLGHLVLPAPEQDTTATFYRDLLGFGLSDTLTLPPPAANAPDQRILFLHARNPRHHSLGLYNFPIPSGCVHVMAEVGSLDEVGCALDRVNSAGVPLLASLGRHENDEMVSFYALGPGGIAVEFGYDGKMIDPETYEATTSPLGDLWGHDYQMPGAEA